MLGQIYVRSEPNAEFHSPQNVCALCITCDGVCFLGHSLEFVGKVVGFDWIYEGMKEPGNSDF